MADQFVSSVHSFLLLPSASKTSVLVLTQGVPQLVCTQCAHGVHTVCTALFAYAKERCSVQAGLRRIKRWLGMAEIRNRPEI